MKRVLSSVLATVMMLACCFSTASAAATTTLRASETISNRFVSLNEGTRSGEVVVTFMVTAKTTASQIGVSSIKIYKANGPLVSTITGTTSNNLIGSSTITKNGHYTYKGVAGTSYYAEVVIFATIGQNTDSRVITTKTVTAPV